MKQLLASMMLIIACGTGAQNVTALDPTQVYSTGSVVNNTMSPTTTTGTWQNIGLWNQGLPCWGPGGPVYCGPQPYFNSGSFNFSYGMTDVYQTANVANSLPGLGSGLRVNGYEFSFMAKNGNGWDDGRQDYLIAYTVFRDAAGAEKFSKTYDLNQNIGSWFNYNFKETFTTPFATRDLGTVQYGFIGMDNNFWAGPYGPEVTNVSFSLKYSVDPCVNNPLYSPTCPGYLDALNKLIPTSTTTTATASAVTDTTSVLPPPPPPGSPPPPPGSQPPPGAPPQPGAAPPPQTTNSAVAATATATQNAKESATPNNSLALSVISKNAERDSAAQSVAQTAVSQAAAAAQQAQQEAASVAASAVANSQSANIVNINGSQSSGTGIRMNSTGTNSTLTAPGVQTVPGAVITTLTPGLQTQFAMSAPVTASQFELLATQPTVTLPMTSTAAATVQNLATLPPNFLTDRTNPLTDIVEGRQVMPAATTTTSSGPAVNSSVGDNDAAGGVSINRMALAPTGYGDYLNFALKDAAFYAPKEVYKNQRTVDNARALRQLSNDGRHREMVEQQYRR